MNWKVIVLLRIINPQTGGLIFPLNIIKPWTGGLIFPLDIINPRIEGLILRRILMYFPTQSTQISAVFVNPLLIGLSNTTHIINPLLIGLSNTTRNINPLLIGLILHLKVGAL